LTHIRKISFGDNGDVFDGGSATRNFAHGLSRNQFLNSLIMYMYPTPSYAAAMIFQALESNSALEELMLGELSRYPQIIGQLIASLPRMKGLKRLYMRFEEWKSCWLHSYRHSIRIQVSSNALDLSWIYSLCT
jgi:hypothetical protein